MATTDLVLPERPATPEEIEELILQEYIRRKKAQRAAGTFIDYVKEVAPWVTIDEVHIAIAEALDRVANGEIDRLMLFIAPRTGKSLFASTLFPTYYIGKFPDRQIMQAGHSTNLAEGFGRDARNTLLEEEFQRIFPECRLSKDSRSTSSWATTAGGKYNAVGVGAGIAGKGFHLGVIDDPLSEQDAYSKTVKDGVWDWYGPGFYTRRMPGNNAIVVIMCMTGDTGVLLPDGSEKLLRDVRPGDSVCSYDNGRLVTSKVLNWVNNGPDSVLEIRMISGTIVKANARHPFLVSDDGDSKWVKTQDLCPGQNIFRAKKASGKEKPVSGMRATNPSSAADSVCSTTRRSGGRRAFARLLTPLNRVVTLASSIGTELLGRITTVCSRLKTASAQSVGSRPGITYELTGAASCASTTATTQTPSEDCYATIAISLLATQKRSVSLELSPSTSDFILDQIVEIVPAGVEEVFDIQIERTENFIANGLVSHNTRWAVDDLAGRLLAQQVIDRAADKWEVLSIPAVLDQQSADLLTRISHDPKYRAYLSGDPITFRPGDSYSPRRWPLVELLRAKGNMTGKAWSALYQQSPYEDEGGILPRGQWRKWKQDKPPVCEYVLQTYDTAFEEEEVNDYSARTTWGVFKRPEDGKYSCILLERLKKRMSFPELRENAYDSYREYEPDRVFIEKKASGHSLIQELRRKSVPVSPVKVKDSKIARAHASSIVLEQGCVYYMDRPWVEEVIQECAEFPNGQHDDLTDTCTMAWNLLRRMFWLQLGDEEDEDDPTERVREKRRLWYLNK